MHCFKIPFRLELILIVKIIFYNHIYVVNLIQLIEYFSWFIKLILKISIFDLLLIIHLFIVV